MPEAGQEKIVVLGLGYVGLPVALALSRKFQTTGFDVNAARVERLKAGLDDTGEVSTTDLKASQLQLTSDPSELDNASFFVVAVPTPIDDNKHPDLSPLRSASETVGKMLTPGAVVVYESTVYPGVTEEYCGPLLEKASGLVAGKDFFLGYSPERINPGDTEHTFERIVKVVSGQDQATLERVAHVYGSVVEAGVHKAPSIKVAEAAKVIENTQRDLNIALMNELALIFGRMGIRTQDVLEAAGTKWNFLKFSPGLVGGHCIGVDPYYLTAKAKQLGYHPEVILAGRSINNSVGPYIGQQTVKLLAQRNHPLKKSKVGVLGLTFKENVSDLRNSRVPDIVHELASFGITAVIHDPLCDPEEVRKEYGLELADWDELQDLDAMIVAVGHDFYTKIAQPTLLERIREQGIVVDVKSLFEPAKITRDIVYWSL